MNEKLLNKWFENKNKIFVYTLTVRLAGVITNISSNSLTLDDHTIVRYENVISISDVEQLNNKKEFK